MADCVSIVDSDFIVTVPSTDCIVIVPESYGIKGDKGDKGDSGAASSSFEHIENPASDTWIVNHNLGFKPNVSAKTMGGAEVVAEVVHNSINQTTIYFDLPLAGIATFS